MAIKEKKTKAQISAAAAAGSRNKKKKWSKGKRQEKQKLTPYLTPETLEQMTKEVAKMRVITPFTISDRVKVNISAARAGLRHLEETGAVKRVSVNLTSNIYTRA